MKYLKHKDYVEAEKPEKVVPDVKSKIKAFVGTGCKSYEEIVKEIQKAENMTNDAIIEQINELQLEDDYKKLVKSFYSKIIQSIENEIELYKRRKLDQR